MTRLSVTEARSKLSDTVNQVSYKGERIILERHGKDLAAMVPMEDVELLNMLEDRIDLRAARAALAEARKKGTVSWNALKKKLNL